MIQEILPMKFKNEYKNYKPRPDDTLLLFRGEDRRTDEILLGEKESSIVLPKIKDYSIADENLVYLFSIDDTRYFLVKPNYCYDSISISNSASVSSFASINNSISNSISTDENRFSFKPLRELRRNNPSYLCFAGMTAYHLYNWYRTHKFCGKCGSKTIHSDKMRMLKCPYCSNMIFPGIAPAVIVGVIKDDSILISTYAGREYKGRALLAGFCEIGETPEETVKREVLEEVGLHVKNIRYYKSQPWGFDSNLLLGYFCEVNGDEEIKMDEEELATASFIKRADITRDPNLLSLTATMIEAFRTSSIQ